MIWWQNRTKNVRTLKFKNTKQSGDTLNDVKQVVKDGKFVWAKYVGEIDIEFDEHVGYIEVQRQTSREPSADNIDIAGDPYEEYEEFSVYYGDVIYIYADSVTGYLFNNSDQNYIDYTITVGDDAPYVDLTTYRKKDQLPAPNVAVEVNSNGLLYVTVTNTSNIYVYAKLYDIQRYFIGSQYVKYDESWMSGYYADPEPLDDPGDYTEEYRSPGSIPAGQSVRLGPFGQGQWFISCWNGFASLIPTESYTDSYTEGRRQEFRGNNNGYIDWD